MTPEQYALLDAKIDKLLRQVSVKPVAAVWSYADIAKWLGKSERTVRDLVLVPSFPKPIDGVQRDPRWFADEVEKWARTHRAKD